jgi:nitric oxide reductase subunit B
MEKNSAVPETLSSWRKHGVVLTMVLGFTVLIWLAVRSYHDAPHIPKRVISAAGETLFTGQDILAGQQVFLKYGLMDNGSGSPAASREDSAMSVAGGKLR